jgi:hypothetical protein
MRHDFVITLDEMPAMGPGPIAPQVGILEPRDDGTAWFPDKAPAIKAYAVDRDGRVKKVTFMAGDKPIGSLDAAPYTFTWKDAPAGCYDITAVAEDDRGMKTVSNRIRAVVGMKDLARGRPVKASSGEAPEKAVDGDYFTSWSAAKGDEQWLYVDLGAARPIDRVNLLWGWKIHASRFTVDVATEDPDKTGSWKVVHTASDRPYKTWEATDRITFDAVKARYVRVSAKKRAGNQNWSGYKLMAVEVPVKAGDVK